MSEEIELIENRAMVMLPEDAIKVEIIATIYNDGKLSEVTKLLSNKEIQKAFKDAKDNYLEDDDKFVFNEDFLKTI